MTDRKIMTSAAAIFAATFATASLAQDALTNPEPGLGADGGQVQMDTSPEAGGLGGAEPDTTGTGMDGAPGLGAETGDGIGGATGLGTTDPADGAGTGTVGGNAGTMIEGQNTPPAGELGADTGLDTGLDTGTATDPAMDGMDATGQTGMDAGADPAAGGMGAAGIGADRTYGSLISGMQTGADFSAELDGLDETAEIQIVRLSSFQGEGAENAEALDQSLAENDAAVTTGRDAVRGNAQVTEALEAEEFDADDVVAVRRSAEGMVEVIVDDRDS